MSETQKMPPEIAKAIVQVMGSVKTLGKSEKNQHGGYQFASIDAFLEATSPLCAAAGLFFLMNEAETEVTVVEGKDGKRTASLRVAYDITICHSSGATLNGIRRNVTVLASGAQAYGSAQSYVLKQFMRSLFQIPTGDKDDADYHPQSEIPPQQPARAASSLSKNGNGRSLYAELQADIDGADSADALAIWSDRRKADIATLPDDWRQELRSRYADKMNDLKFGKELTHVA